MTTFEWVGLLIVIFISYQLVDLQRTLGAIKKEVEQDKLSDLDERIERIEDLLEGIEKHTGRVVEPLYEQDEIDREHLVGRYDPDRLR
ncbi:MAG: hypothetical protein AAGH57_07055 [Pseudomonadota bacterium]